MRQTSIDAYNTIKANGLLGKRQFQVYCYVYKNGPCTARQVFQGLAGPTDHTGSYNTRLSELRKKGVVQEIGTTVCKQTKNEVILWDVTDKLPKKIKKKEKQVCLMCGQTIREPK